MSSKTHRTEASRRPTEEPANGGGYGGSGDTGSSGQSMEDGSASRRPIEEPANGWRHGSSGQFMEDCAGLQVSRADEGDNFYLASRRPLEEPATGEEEGCGVWEGRGGKSSGSYSPDHPRDDCIGLGVDTTKGPPNRGGSHSSGGLLQVRGERAGLALEVGGSGMTTELSEPDTSWMARLDLIAEPKCDMGCLSHRVENIEDGDELEVHTGDGLLAEYKHQESWNALDETIGERGPLLGYPRPAHTRGKILTALLHGYSKVVRALAHHIRGTRRAAHWTSTSQLRAGVARLLVAWLTSCDWGSLSTDVEQGIAAVVQRWEAMDSLPESTYLAQELRMVQDLTRRLSCEASRYGDKLGSHQRYWDEHNDAFERCWTNTSGLDKELHSGISARRLINGYREGLLSCHAQRGSRCHHWMDTTSARAAGMAMTDSQRRLWLGPTRGCSWRDRAAHRRLKAQYSREIFKATLAHDVITTHLAMDPTGSWGPVMVRPVMKCKRGGYTVDEEASLFAQYVARVEQLPRKAKEGLTEHPVLHRIDFDKLSRRRQLLELGKLGLASASTSTAQKLFVRTDDVTYPTTHNLLSIPDIHPRGMKTADLLHHRVKLAEKIQRLATSRRELRREGRAALRSSGKRAVLLDDGNDIGVGIQRSQNQYGYNMSIKQHVKLLEEVNAQIKARLKLHRLDSSTVFVDELERSPDTLMIPNKQRTRRGHKRPCRHHTRPWIRNTASASQPAFTEEDNTEGSSTPLPFLQELRQRRLKSWSARKVLGRQYRTAQDRVGGYISDDARVLDSQDDTGTRRLKVCSINIAGFDDSDNKLEMILQFVQDEAIDVMVCIDAQLDSKRGDWYGKIAKRRLGVGTRTNTNPCILDYGTGNNGKFRRVGGIFTIIGPRWGTSLVGFQADKFGPNGGSAGVMTEVTLATNNGNLNVIGAYWPNSHSSADLTDQNLWRCLTKYVLVHKQMDRNPTELMKRVAMQWIATAFKNGSRGSVLCGDLNATWTGKEAGGQAVLQDWASGFSLHNGVHRVSQKLACSMYTRGPEGKTKSWIDHVLHKGSPDYIDFMAGYTSQASEWEGMTDHRPIWGVFRVQPALQRCPVSSGPQKVRYELRLSDRHKCEEFTEAMEMLLALPSPTDASSEGDILEYMRHIESCSSSTVKDLYNRAGQQQPRSSHKDGWSPTYIAYKAHLTTLVEIRRRLLGQAGQVKWVDVAAMQADLPDILALWDDTLDNLDLTAEQRDSILGCTVRSLAWWKLVQGLPDVGGIDDDMDRIKHQMHGSSRSEMRRRINLSIRYREDLRREGKWKRVISSVLGNFAGRKHRPGIDLNMVQTDDGKILGEAEEIHDAVTDQFEQSWFDQPETSQGSLHGGDNWDRCLTDEQFFVRDTAYTGAPEVYRRLIHKAIVSVPQRAIMHTQLEDLCRDPPSLEEFEAAIQAAKTNSAAGMSGCSYNQLKRWPPELIRNLHYCLSRLWATRTTPEWWTNRWLVTIPKKEEEIPHVSNMRPLILVEAVRKLWCKLLLKRILKVWTEHDVLHQYQHGFIHGRSTMTASTLFINMLEDAIEHGRPLHTCTWDITKAFDSVSKNVMRLAWSRLGVPNVWIQWLVGMDEGGMTVVRTPHAVDVWNKVGLRGFRKRSGIPTRSVSGSDSAEQVDLNDTDVGPDGATLQADGFVAARGTGQGDVTSPSCWAALFDILLTALHMDMVAAANPKSVSAGGNGGYMEGETAYADDLLSCARTPEALQRKADIVSTFCMIMGLQLSTSKLRRFVMAHSGLDENVQPSLLVHKFGKPSNIDGVAWSSEVIEANSEGVLEYLGGKYDMHGDAVATLGELKVIATTHCAEIGNTAATGLTKISVANMTTYAKMRYKAKLSALNLVELRVLDKTFYKFHTKATKNMRSFPYDLLYQDPKQGGVGLKRFSDLASMDKLSEMFRSLHRQDDVSNAMQGILQRMARRSGHAVGDTQPYKYGRSRGVRSWLRGATEWLEDHDVYLWRGGNGAVAALSQPLSALDGLLPAQLRRLKLKRIFHVADIVSDSAGGRIWHLPAHEDWLVDFLPEDPPEGRDVLVWPGQFWRPCVQIQDIQNTDVVEIIHVVDGDQIELAIWRMTDRDNRFERHTKQAHNITVAESVLFPGRQAERVDQGGLIGRRCIFKNTRIVPTPKVGATPTSVHPDWVNRAMAFCIAQGPTYRPRFYTDGAYKEQSHDMHSVFDTEAVHRKSAAGVVIIHDGADWRERPIHALYIGRGADADAPSAFTMEYLALAAAMRMQCDDLRGTATCTDCSSVMKLVQNRRVHLGRADTSHHMLLQSINTSIGLGAVVPKWVPSHAERRNRDRTRWSMNDWGNWLADKVAGNQRNQLDIIALNYDWHETTARHILRTMPRARELYYGDAGGSPIALYGLMEHVHRTRLDRYLAQRDYLRGSPKWLDNTMRFAATVFNEKRKSVSRYAHTARIIWDKHWHGGNRQKQDSLSPEERRLTVKCHMCGGQDSQHHCFRWCSHSNVKAVRNETTAMLRAVVRAVEKRVPDNLLESQQQISTAAGVLEEFLNCPDAGRVWTGNWNSAMVMRLQESTRTDHISKTQCNRLRKILHEMYSIIAQGANDIMDLRHGVRDVLNVRRALQDRIPSVDKGQQDIRCWLLDNRGISGKDRAKILANEADDTSDDSYSILSDDPLAEFDWNANLVEAIPEKWIPDVTDHDAAKTKDIVDNADHGQQILTTVGRTEIRAVSLRRLISGLEIDSAIIDSYLTQLSARSTRRKVKVMSADFMRTRDTSSMRLDNDVDIYNYDVVLIPMLVRSHWTLVMVDIEKEQIRYFDSLSGDGLDHLVVVKRWLASVWRNGKSEEVFPSDRWRLVPSTPATTPQQQDMVNCGIFVLMFAELLADGQHVERFSDDSCPGARRYIAQCLLHGCPQRVPGSPRSPQHSSPVRTPRPRGQSASPRKTLYEDMTSEDAAPADGSGDYIHMGERSDIDPGENLWPVAVITTDMTDALDSTRAGQWLTDTVLVEYFQLLNTRNTQGIHAAAFYSPHFFNRLFDWDTKRIRGELYTHTDNRGLDGFTDLDHMRGLHDYTSIFDYKRAYFPVGRPQHWSLLELDNESKTITHIDSLFTGGEEYAEALALYLNEFERELRGTVTSWRIRSTARVQGKCRKGKQVRVPRQDNSDDCGVFVCAFADQLERGGDVLKVTSVDMPDARVLLRRSLLEGKALLLTGRHLHIDEHLPARDSTSSTVVQTTEHLMHPTTTAQKSPSKDKTSSSRTKRTTRNATIQYNENSPVRMALGKLRRLRNVAADPCHLAIGPSQQYDGGEELYLYQDMCAAGTTLTYYTGRHISRAEKEASNSKYIFEIPTGDLEPIFLDADDPNCGYARYSDDALCGTSENAKWVVHGTGSHARMALVATQIIVKGMPIRAAYGWEYWFQPESFTVDLMRKAFLAYLADDVFQSVTDYQKAWEFASAVNCQDMLLTVWGGIHKHKETDSVIVISDDGSSDDGSSVDTPGSTYRGIGVITARIIPQWVSDWLRLIQSPDCDAEVHGSLLISCPGYILDALIDALRHNQRIQRLYLTSLNFTEAQLRRLISVLRTTRIYDLDIRGTKASKETWCRVLEEIPYTFISWIDTDFCGDHNLTHQVIKSAACNRKRVKAWYTINKVPLIKGNYDWGLPKKKGARTDRALLLDAPSSKFTETQSNMGQKEVLETRQLQSPLDNGEKIDIVAEPIVSSVVSKQQVKRYQDKDSLKVRSRNGKRLRSETLDGLDTEEEAEHIDDDYVTDSNRIFRAGLEQLQQQQLTLQPASTGRIRRVKTVLHSPGEPDGVALSICGSLHAHSELVDECMDTGRNSQVHSGEVMVNTVTIASGGHTRVKRTRTIDQPRDVMVDSKRQRLANQDGGDTAEMAAIPNDGDFASEGNGIFSSGLEQQQRTQATLRPANTGRARRVNTATHSTALAVDAAICFGKTPPVQRMGAAEHEDKCVDTGRSLPEDSRSGEDGHQAQYTAQVGAKNGSVKRKRAHNKHRVSHDKDKRQCLAIPEDENEGATVEKPTEERIIPVVRQSALRQAAIAEYFRAHRDPK